MTDQEKLIEILAKYFTIGDSYEYSLIRVKEAFAIGTMTLDDFVEFDDDKVADIADYLLSYGVTVKEPQKPLTFEELMERHDGVWYENCIVIEPMMISHEKEFSLVYNENVVIGMLRGCVLNYFKHLELPISGYGKTWRCWAEKPTDEERKAAEWQN